MRIKRSLNWKLCLLFSKPASRQSAACNRCRVCPEIRNVHGESTCRIVRLDEGITAE
jgi:hypothetical protein